MTLRGSIISVVALVAIGALGLPRAMQKGGPLLPMANAQEEAPNRLVIDDFEDDVEGRWRNAMDAETDLVKEGLQAGSWRSPDMAAEIRNSEIPHDWTNYSFVEFWCYSGVANDSEVAFNAYTDNDATEGIDYFQYMFKVTWDGWKHFRIPLDAFRLARQATMEKIDHIAFSNTGWDMVPAFDTVLVFDDLVLTRGAQRELLPAVIEDFEGDASLFWGMDTVEYDGRKCGRWHNLMSRRGALARPFEDWSGYDFLEMDIASVVANEDQFMITVESNDPETEGADFWQHRVTVNWEGWRHLKIPLKAMVSWGKPMGWHMITSLNMLGDGWDLPEKPDTDLYFDDIKLTKIGESFAMPPGVIDNFEADFSFISGLEIVEYEGRRCGRWSNLDTAKMLSCRPVEDWREYDFLEMDIASVVANDDEFLIMAESENPDTGDAPDYWDYWATVNWTGWRHFKIPLKRMHPMRKPLGWNMITGLKMFANGWGMPEKLDTELYFDDIKLTKGDGTPLMPPGMIDNFEWGRLSWWGSIGVETEHVGGGKQAMRISTEVGEARRWGMAGDQNRPIARGYARMDAPASPKGDWSGKKLRIWAYVSGLGGKQGELEVWLDPPPAEMGQVQMAPPSQEYRRQIATDGECVLEFAIAGSPGPDANLRAISSGSLRLTFTVPDPEEGAEPFICVDEIRIVD